eukprot:g13303.t1
MPLLVPTGLDRLERVLESAAAAASSAMSAPFSSAAPLSRDRMLGGGLGSWPAGDGGVRSGDGSRRCGRGRWLGGCFVAEGEAAEGHVMSSRHPRQRTRGRQRMRGRSKGPPWCDGRGADEGAGEQAVRPGAMQPGGGQNDQELLNVVLEDTNVHRHVAEILATTSPAEGEDRWPSVVELERAASNTKLSGVAGNGALVLLLREVALIEGDDPEEERKQHEEAESNGAGAASELKLMAVHASKELKFDMVFVSRCDTEPPPGRTPSMWWKNDG